MARKATAAERDWAIAWFKKHCPKGSTLYTILRHKSASGMTRRIGLVAITNGNFGPLILWPDHAGSVLYNDRYTYANEPEGVTVRGCGMDMGFELVYSIAHAVYGDGYALKHQWL